MLSLRAPRRGPRPLGARALSFLLIAAVLVGLLPADAQASLGVPSARQRPSPVSVERQGGELAGLVLVACDAEREAWLFVVLEPATPPSVAKSAFGELLAHTGNDPQPYAFAGEPLDPSSGFQYHRARWMDPMVGRFSSSDAFQAESGTPATLHRYVYAIADPLNRRDPTGFFPTGLHNRILEMAFQGVSSVSESDLRTFKIMSLQQDDLFLGEQGTALSYQHAMSGPRQTIAEAEALYNSFIADNLASAQQLEHVGGHGRAVEFLGRNFHAIADNDSPAHTGFQVWDPTNPWLVANHIAAEANPPQWAIQAAVRNVREHYFRFRGAEMPLRISAIGLSGFSSFSSSVISFGAFIGF